MAKLSAHGQELFRFLSLKRGGLIAVMADGAKLLRTPYHGWKLISRYKPELTAEQREFYNRERIEWYNALPAWRKVKSLPSMRALEHWSFDSVAETTLGDSCEPDACSPEQGYVSWLVALRLI